MRKQSFPGLRPRRPSATKRHRILAMETLENRVVLTPSLTAGGTPATAQPGGAAAAVDPNLTLTDPSGPNLTSSSVSIGTNFTPAEDRLLFTAQNGITGNYNTSTGILTLIGSATVAQYQDALRSVQYQDINTNPAAANEAPRLISFSIAPGTFNPDNRHFYQFVQSPGITWTNAKIAADAQNLYGMKGYLATLTSQAENVFAFSKTLSTGWIGASDAGNVGHWQWADGPESGLQFWQGLSNGSPVNGEYNDWNGGEPNDSGGVEFYAQYLNSGRWNDLANNSIVQGYLIEFGGSTGDPTLQLTSQATVNVVSFTDTPTVANPAAATIVNAPNFTLQGTADAGSLVKIYNDVNNNGVIDLGDTVVGSVQLTPGQTSYSIAVPLTQNAPNNFLVTATASPTSESSVAVVPTLTSDSIPPDLPIVTSPSAAVSVNTGTTVITGTAEAGSLVRVYADTNDDGVIDAGDQVVGSQQLTADQTSYGITTPLALNAANHFLVSALDAGGNQSGAVVVPVVTEDSIPPVAPTEDTPSGPVSVNTPTATLTGTAEAGSLVQVYDDANGDGVLDAGESVVGTQQLAPGQSSYSVTVPLNPNAANNFLVAATDAGGNRSPLIIVPTITQDSIPPADPAVGSPDGPTTVNSGSTVITGTAEPGSLVRVYRDYNNNGMIDAGDTVAGYEQLAPGQTTYSITTSLALNAANHFLVSALDAGGNQSGAVVVPVVIEDSIPPAVLTSNDPAGPISVNATTRTFVGTAEAGSLVQVFRDTNSDGVIGDSDAVVGLQQLAPGQISYSITVPLVPNAANHFLISAADVAGNHSTPIVVPTITQNSIAPTIASVRRFGYHMHPTYLVLSFDGQMDPARVQDAANYRIVDSQGHAIRIASVQYDPTANAVTIVPASRLDVYRKYRLTVSGTGLRGLADFSGNMLDGLNNGQAGSSFTATIDRAILAGQSPFTPVVPAHAARTASVHRAALDSVLAGGVRIRKSIATRHAHA